MVLSYYLSMNEFNSNWITEPIITVKFKQTHPDAILPRKNHSDPKTGDVGFDLFAVEDTIIPETTTQHSVVGTTETGGSLFVHKTEVGNSLVPIGIKVADITPGYWFRIEGRSGLGFAKGVQPHFGVIDNPYRGDLSIKLYNLTGKPVLIKKGQACAQFVVYKMYNVGVDWSIEVTETERGEKGFGSSDSK
jgi:dUTP pyrophosphatase